MAPTPDSEAPQENPRTRRVRELMLETAVELLLECGAHDVTAAQVAARADVARTTVYRQWPDQRSLLLATIAAMTTPHETPVSAGPVEDDARATLERLRKRLDRRPARAVFGALVAHASQDKAFKDAQQLFINQLTKPMVEVFEAAVARGELDKSTDAEFEAMLLVGPILHNYLALHAKVTDQLIDEVLHRWSATRS